MSSARNYILEAKPTIFGYEFDRPITFGPHLNLISGPNGTMKSNLLLKLRGDPSIKYAIDGQAPRLQAISPRRNIESQNVEAALQQFATNKNYEEKLYNARNLALSGFEPYPSLASLFSTAYEIRRRKGRDQIEAMESATLDLNGVLQRILRNYKLKSEWDEPGGGFPSLSILKDASIPVPLDGLSAGEREALNLALYLYTIRERYDVILVDEPEVHLNWSLEEELFGFLLWFAQTFEKQLIVVTHSRVVFDARYAPNCRFLDFNDSRQLVWHEKPSKDILDKLAGASVRLLQIAHTDATHIYVEDLTHAMTLRELVRDLDAAINVVDLGDRGRVEGFYKSQQSNGDIGSNFFVVDGDNRPSKVKGDQFIQLDCYCIENCLIDPDVAASVSGRDAAEVSALITNLIKRRSPPSNKHTEFFKPILRQVDDSVISKDIVSKFDASEIFPSFLKEIDFDKETYIRAYVRASIEMARIADVFGENIELMYRDLQARTAPEVNT